MSIMSPGAAAFTAAAIVSYWAFGQEVLGCPTLRVAAFPSAWIIKQLVTTKIAPTNNRLARNIIFLLLVIAIRTNTSSRSEPASIGAAHFVRDKSGWFTTLCLLCSP